MATAGDRYDQRTGNIWSYAHRGDMTGLKAAMVRGVDVNLTNTVGWTACHAAAAGGQTKALRYLVTKANADLSITDHGGNLAIHHAAKHGHVHALRTLQELGGADLTKVRLSQTKGKAVRDLVVESYRKANKELHDDEDDAEEPAVGYARKQSKSTAFWGPRRTPISCAIKKKIIKDKRKLRKEKQKAKRESERNELHPEEEETSHEEEGEQHEPSYQETVQDIKRSRKQRRRRRQKPCIQEQERKEENPIIDNKISDEDKSDNDDSDDDDDEDDERFLSTNGRFAALALIEDDSDSE